MSRYQRSHPRMFNGKTILITETIPQPRTCAFRIPQRLLAAWRNRLIEHAERLPPGPLRDSIGKIKTCGRSFRTATWNKLPPETKLSKPCGARDCPHCEQAVRFRYFATAYRHLVDTPFDQLGMLTLKLGIHSERPRSLAALLRSVRTAYRKLFRTRAFLAKNGGPFVCGVWRIHCTWRMSREAWDVHIHILVAGIPTEAQIEAIRRHWTKYTGNKRKLAVHWKPMDDLGACALYVSNNLTSVFRGGKRPKDSKCPKRFQPFDQAWSILSNPEHREAVEEYLYTMKQRVCHLFGRFGAPAVALAECA